MFETVLPETVFGPFLNIDYEDKISTPTQPQNSLLRIFRLQPGLERNFLLKRTWSGRKLLPLQFPGRKDNQVSLARTFLCAPGSESESADLGAGVGQMFLRLSH